MYSRIKFLEELKKIFFYARVRPILQRVSVDLYEILLTYY